MFRTVRSSWRPRVLGGEFPKQFKLTIWIMTNWSLFYLVRSPDQRGGGLQHRRSWQHHLRDGFPGTPEAGLGVARKKEEKPWRPYRKVVWAILFHSFRPFISNLLQIHSTDKYTWDGVTIMNRWVMKQPKLKEWAGKIKTNTKVWAVWVILFHSWAI